MSTSSRKILFVGALFCSYAVLGSAGYAANLNASTETVVQPKKVVAAKKPVAAKKNQEVNVENTDSWRGKSVFDRARPDYTSEGIRARSFKVKPTLSVEETFDDNIYATQNSTKSDFVTSVKPGIELESDWSRHALSLNASGNIGSYSNYDDENYGDFNLGAAARLDVLRDTFITGSAATSHLHEDRGSADSRATGKNPTEYDQDTVGLAIMRQLRRVSAKLSGDYTGYDYENGRTSTGTSVLNDDRDRKEYKVTGRLGYEIIPEYEAFIRGSLNQRDYNLALDASGLNRDSDGYEIVGGTAINISGKTKGEVFVGYMSQDYDSARLKTIDGVQFGGNILWNATGLTSVKAGVLRDIQETTISNASGIVATSYSLAIEHELRYNLLAGLNTSYTVNDYNSNTSAAERSDNVAGAGAELRYLLGRRASIVGKYNYSTRDSNQLNQDYDRSVVTLGLKLSM